MKNAAIVDKDGLRKLGAADVFEVSGGLQAVYGARTILYKDTIIEMYDLED